MQRTAEVLDYTSDNFFMASGLSIPLSIALASQVHDQKEFVPCVLPHSHGFFLGTAHYRPEASQHLTFLADYYPESTRYQGGYVDGGQLNTPMVINIKTSISACLFSANQWRFFDMMRPFMEDDRMKLGLNVGVDLYSLGAAIDSSRNTSKDKQLWEEACKRLSEIVASDAWRTESRAAWKNFQKSELN